MNVLILDPGLFEISGDMQREFQMEHFFVLKESIEYASEYINATLDEYYGAPYSQFYDEAANEYYNPPITKSHYLRSQYVMIKRHIHKMMIRGRNIEISKATPVSSKMTFEANTKTEIPFRKYLDVALFSEMSNNVSYLLLLSTKNSKFSPKLDIHNKLHQIAIDSVCQPAVNCMCIVGKYLRNNLCGNAMFPNSPACDRLNDEFLRRKKDESKNQSENRSLYIQFGKEVATRNYYSFDDAISQKNRNYYVFVNPRKDYFLSIDLEHGGLEVFKKVGKKAVHMGEYNYSCYETKGADPQTHQLVI